MPKLIEIPKLSPLKTHLHNGVPIETNEHPSYSFWINPKHIVCIEPVELYRLESVFEDSSGLLGQYQKKLGDSYGPLHVEDIPLLDERVLYFKNSFHYYFVKDCVKLTLTSGKVCYSSLLYKSFVSAWENHAGCDIIDFLD